MIDYQYYTADDGAQIAYVCIGKGTPLLYFHGMGSSIESQMPLIDSLKDTYQVILFDQRGYGVTPSTSADGIQRSVLDGRGILEHLGIEKTILFGYSMGGCCVFSYLQQFGCDKVEKIIVAEMSPKLINEDEWKFGLYQGWYTRSMYEEDVNRIKNGQYKIMALNLTEGLLFHADPEDPRNFLEDEEALRERIREGVEQRKNEPLYGAIADVLLANLVDISDDHIRSNLGYWETMAGRDYRDAFEKITVPALYIAAKPGSGYAPATAEWMAAHTPDSRIRWMEGCGHMCSAENRPQFVAYLKEFHD